MKSIISILFALFICSEIFPQEKPASQDSAAVAITDSSSIERVAEAKPFEWQHFSRFSDPAEYPVPAAATRELIFEDEAEFLDQMPFLQIWRDGDTGLFAHASLHAAPSRFTEFFIDGLAIPAGIWGQRDLTFLPETALENMRINPWTNRVNFELDTSAPKRPETQFDFVLGPYSSDAVRLRFKRKLGKTWRLNWGATFANSDGQYFTPDFGPFEANRVHGLIVRNLRPDLEIRYRFVQTVNNATQSQPFFIDEYPQIAGAKRDQRRFMNSIELARLVRDADSSRQHLSFDRWRLRLFNWHLQEQYSSSGFGPQRYIKPQSDIRGFSAFYLQKLPGILAKYQINFEDDHLENEYFPELGHYQRANTGASFLLQRKKYTLNFAGFTKYNSEFSLRAAAEMTLNYRFMENHNFQISASTKPAFPHPGEYAHTIDTVFAANSGLKAMQLTQVGLGYFLQRKSSKLTFTGGRAVIDNAFELGLTDSLLQIVKNSETVAYPFITLMAEFDMLKKIHLKLQGTARFSTPDSSYLFAEMPAIGGWAEMAYKRPFFEGDLLAQVLVRARFWMDRYHFYHYRRGHLLDVWPGGGNSLLDIEVRGFFRDAMIFMKFENVLGTDDFWRYNVPMRWRTMKWGVSWNLWD